MSDEITRALMGGNWDWRSNMAQPSPYDSRGQQPQAQSFRPRTIIDNVPPMVADGLSAAGASGPVAGDYAERVRGLANAIPPVGMLNLASGIGNEAHNGNYGRAAGLSVISALMGLYGRGLMPGNRDAGMAKMLERMDGIPAIANQGKTLVSDLARKPGMRLPQNQNFGVPSIYSGPPANTNSFGVVRQ